jgi:hypothetical protein
MRCCDHRTGARLVTKSQRMNRISPNRKAPAEEDCGQLSAGCHARSKELDRLTSVGANRDRQIIWHC